MSHTNSNLKSLLATELTTRYSLTPTQPWLTSFLSTLTRPPPLPALTSTAHFKLLSTNFRVSLVPTPGNVFLPDVGNVQVKNSVLGGDIPVQVLEVIDTGTSLYTTIESIERVERGEEVRGREVIRSVPGANEDDDDESTGGARGGRQGQGQRNSGGWRQSGSLTSTSSTGPGSGSANSKKGTTGPHKLLLQDAAGTTVWAFELSRIEKITIINTGPVAPGATTQPQVEGIQIGCKLLLKAGTSVRRGMLMLTPSNTVFMGGKVEAWDRKWREGRKGALQERLDSGVESET